MNSKALVVIAVVVVAAAVGGVYFAVLRHHVTSTVSPTSVSSLASSRPGEVNESQISSLLGGNWSLLSNVSLVASVNKGVAEIYFLNGTNKTLANSTDFEMPGPSGQPNGGYPEWLAVYSYMSKSGNQTFLIQIEIFRVNETQVNWTLSGIESTYRVSPKSSDGLTYVELTPYAPLSNITYFVASYQGRYILIIISFSNASPSQLLQLAEASSGRLSSAP